MRSKVGYVNILTLRDSPLYSPNPWKLKKETVNVIDAIVCDLREALIRVCQEFAQEKPKSFIGKLFERFRKPVKVKL